MYSQLLEAPSKVAKASGKEAVANIDDFVPDEEIDTNFLAEEGDEEHNKLFRKERLTILPNSITNHTPAMFTKLLHLPSLLF